MAKNPYEEITTSPGIMSPSPGVGGVAQGVGTASPVGEAYMPTRVVDPVKETVQGQIKGIIADDAPFMQAARTRSAQAANAKGLLNSSMAVTAGEAAAYDAALPIANADAQTYKSAGDINFGAQTGAGMARLTTALDEGAKSRLMNQQARENLNVESALQTMKGVQAKELAAIEDQYRRFSQLTQSTGQIFAQASSDLRQILADPNIPAENKQGLVDKHVQLLRSALTVQGGINNLDLAGLLTFG